MHSLVEAGRRRPARHYDGELPPPPNAGQPETKAFRVCSSPDLPVHARVRVRPDEQLHRHRRGAARPRPPRRVRRRGVVGRQARAARLRGGSRRSRAAGRDGRRPRPRTPGQFWNDFIRETAPEFRKPTVEQLETFMQPTYQALIDGAKYCEPQLREIIAPAPARRHRRGQRRELPGPETAGVPFVRIVSCNPLEVRGDELPPPFSGLPSRRPRASGTSFPRGVRPHAPADVAGRSTTGCSQPGPLAAARPRVHARPRAAGANLYVYPPRSPTTPTRRPLDATLARHGLQRARDRRTPYVLARGTSPTAPPTARCIYLSLGSLGGADVELMRRLVDVLGRDPAPLIVSKGPQADRDRARRQHGRGARSCRRRR